MIIIFGSSEVAPFSKSGGLADVSYSLPLQLSKNGIKVIIVTPFYKCIKNKKLNLKKNLSFKIKISEKEVIANILEYKINKNLKILFVKNNAYFDRDELYTTEDGDYPDNSERFIFLSKVIVEIVERLDLKVDIFHLNDWQTSLAALYLYNKRKENYKFKNIYSLFTIHNLAYQGIFWRYDWHLLNISDVYFTPEGIEYYNNINFMKAGLIYSDFVTTVSKKYAEEIKEKEFGFGLDGLLKSISFKLKGILNGVDYNIWSPENDKFIIKNYDINTLENKELCKKDLLKEVKLEYKKEVPLYGMISRITEQKGIDLIIEALSKILKKLDIQVVILGKGDKNLEKKLKRIEKKFLNKIRIITELNEKLAHKIEAGSDFYLMPSKFEPCGLNQIYSLKYGTPPIVRAVGGLDDTIKEFDEKTLKGNGFKFNKYASSLLIEKIIKSYNIYKNKSNYRRLQQNGMKEDFSWQKSAKEYIKLYKSIIEKNKEEKNAK